MPPFDYEAAFVVLLEVDNEGLFLQKELVMMAWGLVVSAYEYLVLMK